MANISDEFDLGTFQERKNAFARIDELTTRVHTLERAIDDLKERYNNLKCGETFCVPVENLSPEPFVVKKTFLVVVRPSDGEFIATLFDANLGMTGDTAEDAVANLKATIVDTFDLFEENEATLGPEPKRQLAILRELIQRRT